MVLGWCEFMQSFCYCPADWFHCSSYCYDSSCFRNRSTETRRLVRRWFLCVVFCLSFLGTCVCGLCVCARESAFGEMERAEIWNRSLSFVDEQLPKVKINSDIITILFTSLTCEHKFNFSKIPMGDMTHKCLTKAHCLVFI